MEQYIPKSALVAEIKRRLKFVEKRLKRNNSYTEEGNTAWKRDKALYDAHNFLLSFLDTIEVKEVDFVKETKKNVDLEDEIDKELDEEWYGEYIDHDKFRKSAKHFFELGLRTQKEKEV